MGKTRTAWKEGQGIEKGLIPKGQTFCVLYFSKSPQA